MAPPARPSRCCSLSRPAGHRQRGRSTSSSANTGPSCPTLASVGKIRCGTVPTGSSRSRKASSSSLRPGAASSRRSRADMAAAHDAVVPAFQRFWREDGAYEVQFLRRRSRWPAGEPRCGLGHSRTGTVAPEPRFPESSPWSSEPSPVPPLPSTLPPAAPPRVPRRILVTAVLGVFLVAGGLAFALQQQRPRPLPPRQRLPPRFRLRRAGVSHRPRALLTARSSPLPRPTREAYGRAAAITTRAARLRPRWSTRTEAPSSRRRCRRGCSGR